MLELHDPVRHARSMVLTVFLTVTMITRVEETREDGAVSRLSHTIGTLLALTPPILPFAPQTERLRKLTGMASSHCQSLGGRPSREK